MKDKSAVQRYAYDQEIYETERASEEWQDRKRNLTRALENFEGEMNRTSRQLQELDEEMIQKGSFSAQWASQEHQERTSFIRNFLRNQEEGISYSFSKVNQELEDRRERLRRERENLPWD